MSRYYISLSLHLSLYRIGPFHNHPSLLFLSLCSSVSSASCRRGKTESDVSQSDVLKCSASQPRVTPTMRLLKSQVDQVDSPPSAGLTTNQYESRLIAANSQISDMRSSRVPSGHGICGTSLNFWWIWQILHGGQGHCVLQLVRRRPKVVETGLFSPVKDFFSFFFDEKH